MCLLIIRANESVVKRTSSQMATTPIATEKLLGSVQHADLPDSSLPPLAIAAAEAPTGLSPTDAITPSSLEPLSDSRIARESPAGASAKQQVDTSRQSDTGTARLPDIELMSIEPDAGGSQNTLFSFPRPGNAIRLVNVVFTGVVCILPSNLSEAQITPLFTIHNSIYC